MSTQRRIQNSDLRLVRPVLLTHRANQAQSEILADETSSPASGVSQRGEIFGRPVPPEGGEGSQVGPVAGVYAIGSTLS